MKRIDYFIDKLDKPQPQVAIEILFVDVQRDGKRELGAQLRNKKINTLGNHNDIETQQIVASATHIAPLRSMIDVVIPEDPPKDYPSFMTIGNSDNIWAVARSVLKTENINVISQPYVIAGNNKESIIEVSDKRNIDGEIEYTTVLPIQKKIDVEAKVEAKITPVINKEGTINLVIFISINEFTGTDNNNRTNRLIQTRTTMTDGEVLVIGGLTQDTKTDSIYKTPILGDIPIIGNFFKGRTKSSVKKDLFVFIRPSLVKPRFEGKPEEYTQLKLDYAKQRVGINTTFLTSKDPIQRWFFMPPSKGKIKTLEDLEKEDVKSIIDFTQGKDIPRSVIPSVDPYYTPEEAPELQRYSERSMSRRKAKQLEKKRKLMEKREKKKQIKLSKRKRRSRLA